MSMTRPARNAAFVVSAFSALGLVSAGGLKLLAVGDWGGVNDAHPYTEAQVAVGAGMGVAAADLQAEMVLMLGDNFYEHGVSDACSPRFNATFADVYNAPTLERLPFYVVAGNHDHLGSVQVQIEYSKVDPRWRFPATHQRLVRSWAVAPNETRTVEILLIDTVELVGNSDGPWGHRDGAHLGGPEDAERADKQWAWLEAALAASTADFLWVGGHYPIYSAGQDGTTWPLVGRLLPLLATHGAHYVCGHNHMFEHIFVRGVHMITAGAGRECCYLDRFRWELPHQSLQFMVSGRHGQGAHVGNATRTPVYGGFASFNFMDEAAEVAFHKEDGARIYTSPRIPRRSARHAPPREPPVEVVV